MKRLFLLLGYWCMGQMLMAQGGVQRVHAGAVAGITIPHVFYGDFYYTIGGHTGVYADARLLRRWALRTEVLYVINPGYLRPAAYPTWPEIRSTFGFVEVPVMARYIPRLNVKDLEFSILGGASYARLMHYRLKTTAGMNLTNEVVMDEREAIVPHIGACFMVKEHFGGEVRLSQPIDINLGLVVSSRLNVQF